MIVSDLKHFRLDEFRCSCCGLLYIEQSILEVADNLREAWGSPLVVTSACRCRARNRAVGGAAESQHLTIRGKRACRAVDLHPLLNSPMKFAQFFDTAITQATGGLGYYWSENPRNRFLHLDTREGSTARWGFLEGRPFKSFAAVRSFAERRALHREPLKFADRFLAV